MRHPMLLAEPDDDRFDAVAALIARTRYPRSILRGRDAADLDRVLGSSRALPCLMVAAELALVSDSLMAIRRDRSTLPIVVTSPRADADTMMWCVQHRLQYLPGSLRQPEVDTLLDDAESYEAAPLSHRAWLVRRGRGEVVRHEVAYVARFLRGDRGRALEGGLTKASRYSVCCRARRHLGGASFEQLRSERIEQWDRFGTGGKPPWRIR